MSGRCARCGGALEPADRFCGYCGAPLGAQQAGAPPAASIPAPVPQPRQASRTGCGCGCGTIGCLGLLLLLGAGGVAAWSVLSESDPEALLDSALESLQRLAGPAIPRGPAEPENEPEVEPDEPDEVVDETPRGRRGLSAEERAALARTAREGGSASERLGAAAALLQAGASGAEVVELEGLQTRALAELDETIAREGERRERFAKEAAAGGWLRTSGVEAEAVWTAAGGR